MITFFKVLKLKSYLYLYTSQTSQSVNKRYIKVEKSCFQTLLIVNFIYESYLYIDILMINLITFDNFYFEGVNSNSPKQAPS